MSSPARAEKIQKAAGAQPKAQHEGEIRRVVRLLSRFLIGQRRQFVLAFLMLIAEAWSATRVPLVLGYLIDYLSQRIAVISNASSVAAPLSPLQMVGLQSIVNPDVDTIAIITIGVVLLTLFNSATDSFAEIYLANGGRLLGYNLRVGLYSHLQKLSLAFFGKQRTGDLLTRVTGDISAIEEFVIKSLSDIVGSILLIIFILYTMIVGAWQVAIIAVLIIPFMAAVSNYFSQRIKDASKKQRAREGELASAAQEMLTSIRVIQTYGSGGSEAKRFAEQSRKAMDTMLQAAKLQAIFSATVSTLESVAVALVIWLAVYLIFGSLGLAGGFSGISAGFTIGTLTVFTKYIADMFKPTKKIIKEWNTFGKIYASVERIGELMDRRPAVDNAPNALQAPHFQGHVMFNQVSFAYMPEPEDLKDGKAPDPKLALRSISFSIAPSEVVALVGGSGAGKSTIVQLLPRLYDPHAGSITIDGQDLRAFTLDSLRGQMSMVLQEAILFTGTVADNIAYGRPGATREEIIAAAMQANAHDFIQQMEKGYDTDLSERASNLSGGQRQRIAIARAFIRNTPILILDEPTTGLDAESTELVLLALRELMRGKATLIISHDLNLIRQADKIIAIKEGQIVQTGTHKELLKQGGLYANLYNKQFGHVAEEQGAKIKPIEPAPPVVVAPPSVAEEDDEDERPVVSPQVFQTLIGKALPAPASVKAFQTLMMHAVVPPPADSKPAAPAAAAPASAAPRPAAAPVAPPKPIAEPPAAAPRPAVAQAAGQPTPGFAPPAPPPIQSQPPAGVSQPGAGVSAGTLAENPKPAIFATTSMRAVQNPSASPPMEAAAPARSYGNGDSPIDSLDDLTYTREMRALQAERQRQSAGAGPGRSRLRGEALNLLNNPAIQSELPGLRVAFDSAAMRQHIQTALIGKAHPTYVVEHCELEQATYLPGEGVTIRYATKITARTTGQSVAPTVIGTLFPSQLACALYMRDKLAPLAELMRGRPEIAAFGAPAAIVEPLNMALHVFPIDGELPTLVAATDPRRIRAVLSETLPQALDGTLMVEASAVELVEYAHRECAVLRYYVESKRANGRIEQQIVYGQIIAGNTGALVGPVTAALRERLLNGKVGDTRFMVPRALGWRPDMQLLLLEAIAGVPMIANLLEARLQGQAAESQVFMLREMIDSSAVIAATLHSSNVKFGRRRSLDDEVATLRAQVAQVQPIAPELGMQLEAWLEQLSTYAEQSDALQLGFCHGDYTCAQVLFEGRQAGLLNFASVCQAEPALDLGHFLAYLKIAGSKTQRAAGSSSHALINELCDRFMNSYLTAMSGRADDAERLRVRVSIYQVVSLLRYALRSWQKFEGTQLENALALIEQELYALPTLGY